MKKLLDSRYNYLKTQENVQKYLKSLPDSQIKFYYETVEFTPFLTMLCQEYSLRFHRNHRNKTG